MVECHTLREGGREGGRVGKIQPLYFRTPREGGREGGREGLTLGLCSGKRARSRKWRCSFLRGMAKPLMMEPGGGREEGREGGRKGGREGWSVGGGVGGKCGKVGDMGVRMTGSTRRTRWWRREGGRKDWGEGRREGGREGGRAYLKSPTIPRCHCVVPSRTQTGRRPC